jgi:AraC-like DNA-binding protein
MLCSGDAIAPRALDMAGRATKMASSSRQAAGVLTRAAYHYANDRGVDADALLRQAGISRDAIDDRAATVGSSNQIRFIELIADALGDDLFGIHLAESLDFREIGQLYYVAASADTLGAALRRAERYIGIQNDGIRFAVSRGKTPRVRFHYVGLARHSDIHQIEALVALVIRILRFLTDRDLKPTRVRLMHARASQKADLERLLDARVETGAGADEIEFPAGSWELPIVSADPYLHRLCVDACEQALARQNRNMSQLKVLVENAIATLLPHGHATHNRVAAALGMSPRTLARRLSESGHSFAGILDGIRSALAERYLADRALSISQIAWLLGYAEVGTFTRAFQRRRGMTPSAARARTWPRRTIATRGAERQISGSK